jgi:regulator of RNase E activity RraA
VIVMANDAGDAMGSWGGLLSLAARLKGVTGVVSNGGCRDVDEARELNFPVFARRAAVRTARGRAHEVSCGEPVELDSVTIRNGDIVVADGTGVVVVGADYAIDVVRRAEEIWRKERTMQTRLRAGSNVQDVLGGSYELMLTENA